METNALAIHIFASMEKRFKEIPEIFGATRQERELMQENQRRPRG
jgi:hypothetical protein